MDTTTSTKTIEKLQSLFARYGVPSQLVSDNGPQFKSEEFQMFLKRNGIKHLTSAPYHPASNGLAERCVQSFKSAMKSETEIKPLSIKLATVLLTQLGPLSYEVEVKPGLVWRRHTDQQRDTRIPVTPSSNPDLRTSNPGGESWGPSVCGQWAASSQQLGHWCSATKSSGWHCSQKSTKFEWACCWTCSC